VQVAIVGEGVARQHGGAKALVHHCEPFVYDEYRFLRKCEMASRSGDENSQGVGKRSIRAMTLVGEQERRVGECLLVALEIEE